MNNYEKIKKMTIDEMAEFLPIAGEYCEVCYFHRWFCKQTGTECKEVVMQWLQSESEDDDVKST